MRTWAIATVTPLLVLTACSAQTHRFDTATELRSAAVNAGLHCTGYNPMTPPAGASSSGECVGGTHAIFVVYDGENAAKKAITDATGKLTGDDAVLAGPNWYVMSSTSALDGIKDSIGGDIKSK